MFEAKPLSLYKPKNIHYIRARPRGGSRARHTGSRKPNNFCSDFIYILRSSLNIYKYLKVNPIIIVNLLEVDIGTYKLQILNLFVFARNEINRINTQHG